MNRYTRDERGAVAVVFGLTAVLLLTMCALGVDLGQAWAQKRQVQASSDAATLAGAGISGNDLPAPSAGKICTYGTGATSSDPATQDVARYVASRAYTPVIAPAAVNGGVVSAMASQLTDCKVSNGEVFYGIPTYHKSTKTWTLAYNKNQLSLVSPPSKVDFGFAGILGINNVNVAGQSTVEIRSPKMSTLPFYAFNGCDYGPQTLQQPNNGQSASTVLLASPDDTNAATLTTITPVSYPVDNSPTLEPLTINGSGFTGVTQIGFFESGNATTGPPPVTSTSFTVVNNSKITMPDIPTQARGVAGVQEFWYVRVMIGGKWSAVYSGSHGGVLTPMLTIGDPPLVCAQGSSSGNFGTLLLSHAAYNGADAVGAANVALGLTNTLAIYPTGGPSDGTCSSAQTTTVLWPTDGTNCVDTDTGMSAKVAIGRLPRASASAAVGGNQYLLKPRARPSARTAARRGDHRGQGQTVNNDTLTCFFLSPTTHVSDVDGDPTNPGGYTGPPLISDAIYDSPRFGYVPVLNVQPANGGSKKYQIVDFRACFITDQPGSAIKGDPPGSATNGITLDSNGVHSVQVIFLNGNALPNPPVKNGTVNYEEPGRRSRSW